MADAPVRRFPILHGRRSFEMSMVTSLPTEHQRWVLMCGLAVALYSLFKLISWRIDGRPAGGWRRAAYLLAWPGMDAAQFVRPRGRVEPPLAGVWRFAGL
jgi:hypothetical protein